MSDWREFLALEPDDGPRRDLRAAVGACATLNRGRKTAVQPADLFPGTLGRARPRRQSREEVVAGLRAWLGA